MQGLILAVGLPLLLLNMLGGIVAGVWLIFIGDWSLFWLGLALGFLGVFLCSIAVLPNVALAAPGIALMQRGNVTAGMLFAAAATLYITVVMVAWSVLTHYVIVDRADQPSSMLTAVWAYGVAVGPWTFLAQKEAQGNPDTPAGMTSFFLQLASLLVGVMYLAGFSDHWTLAYAALAVMAVPAILSMLLVRELNAR